MFDLVRGTVERPFCDRHIVPTVASAVGHIVVIGAVVATAWFVVADGLPEVPERMMVFVTAAPPPPPPPPAPVRRPETPPAEPATPPPVAAEPELVAPVTAPAAIVAETGLDFGIVGGVAGGVAGGIPGGVPRGVVGGLTIDAPPPAPPPAPAAAAPVRVGGNIEVPELVRRVEPTYPKAAAAANLAGLVVLEATVDEHGDVTAITVLRSRGLLDQAAIDAVKQWRYEPLLLNGIPRQFVLTVTLSFSLT